MRSLTGDRKDDFPSQTATFEGHHSPPVSVRESKMLALTSATGKLGSAVLNAVVANNLIDPKDLVVCVLLPHMPFIPSSILTHPDIVRPK